MSAYVDRIAAELRELLPLIPEPHPVAKRRAMTATRREEQRAERAGAPPLGERSLCDD